MQDAGNEWDKVTSHADLIKKKGRADLIPFDQLQKSCLHLLDKSMRRTSCGKPLRKYSLSRTRDLELVIGSIEDFSYFYRDTWPIDRIGLELEEPLTKPYLCDWCLDKELPNLVRRIGLRPWKMANIYHEKAYKRTE
jgi:hypothetical protein